MVGVDGGLAEIGASADGFAYDNERPRHERELDDFEIDRTPVTNGAFAAYVAETGAEPPMFWERDGEGGWLDARFGLREPLDPRLPVVHVSWESAADYAAWAGKRLPSEFEWERAAEGSDPARANFDHLGYGPAPAGAYADGASRWGAQQMMGDVWEWTASRFEGYPGLQRLPLSRVLRGLLRWRLPGPPRRLLGRTPRCRAALVPQLGSPVPAPDLRRLPLREGRLMDVERAAEVASTENAEPARSDPDRRPPPGLGEGRLRPAPRRPRGAHGRLQGAAAEVLLRRARLGVVRADHASCPSTTRPGSSARSSPSRPRRSSPLPTRSA